MGADVSLLDLTERGEPRELHWEHDFREDEPHIELRFALRGEEGLIDVWAGCNHMSGTVEVTDTELEARITDITDRDCDPPELHEQDDWLRHTFLRSGPTWELDGSHLTLRSEDTVIEFEEVNG